MHASSLDEMCLALNDLEESRPDGVAQAYHWQGSGLQPEYLPLFGGDQPASTEGVFSWDTEGLLVCGDGPDFCKRTRERRTERRPRTIVDRADYEAA